MRRRTLARSGILPGGTDRRRCSVREKQRQGGCIVRQTLLDEGEPEHVGERLVDDEPAVGQLDRRRHELCPALVLRPQRVPELPQPGHAAGNADGAPAFARVASRLAVRAKVHVARRCGRGGLAEVECVRFSVHARDEESPAPDVPCRRPDDRQRQRARDHGVGGVPAPGEDVDPDFGGQRRVRGNHAHAPRGAGAPSWYGHSAGKWRGGDAGAAGAAATAGAVTTLE